MSNVWLEVAINGPWSRDRQPRIPLAADEIVDEALVSADQGAAVVHFHAYDPKTGRQRDDYEIYAPIIERIRARADVICYPTVEKLLQAGLIEWSALDPGSTNIAHFSDIAEGKPGFIYANPESHIHYGLELAQRYAMTPSYAIYEPGFIRLGAALHRMHPGAPTPVYRLMFSDGIAFGFPATPWALDAYLRLLEREAHTAPWMVAGLGVDIEPLIDVTVERGGHVRVGLEDAPMGCASSNREIVERAVRRIESAGGRLAGPDSVRAVTRAVRAGAAGAR
jgi:3-keto-5-aminohexanoate cleavage enzyme